MHRKEFEYRDFEYPGKEIHYSDLAVWRECPAKFNYRMTEVQHGTKSNLMLLGSVFHNAFDVASNYKRNLDVFHKQASHPEWWAEQIQYQLVRRVGESYDVGEREIFDWSNAACNKMMFNGKTLADIVVEMYKWLDAIGIVPVENELRLEYGQFVGTLDLLGRDREGDHLIIDIKTTGLWTKMLNGKSTSKQQYEARQLLHHPQLKHYHWMLWRTGKYELADIKYYGIGLPTNLIPYTTGKNKGKHRGLAYQMAKANPKAVKRYEEDMFAWLTQIEEGYFVRSYPNMFGKISCARCPYMNVCHGDQDSTFVPEYLR